MTSTVPPGRDSLHRYPGTSYLATISLSLRDKSHSSIVGPRIKLALMGGRRTCSSRTDLSMLVARVLKIGKIADRGRPPTYETMH